MLAAPGGECLSFPQINTLVYLKCISFLPARFTLMYGFSDPGNYECYEPLGKIVPVPEPAENNASASLVTRAASPVGSTPSEQVGLSSELRLLPGSTPHPGTSSDHSSHFHRKLALNMKFQLSELNLPFPDKTAKSLAETLRINMNGLLKWVNRLTCTRQKPSEVWRPLKEVDPQCHCQIKRV